MICVLCLTWRGDVRWRNTRGWMRMVLMPYDLFSWNKYDINLDIIDNIITFEYIDKGPLRMLTLSTLGPLHHAWLFFPSSYCSMLPPSLLGVDCLSRFLSGGPGPPSPPFPTMIYLVSTVYRYEICACGCRWRFLNPTVKTIILIIIKGQSLVSTCNVHLCCLYVKYVS